MYQNIVLAYDSMASSSTALRQSVDLARHCKAELHLVGVVNITPATVGAGVAITGGYPVADEFWRQDHDDLRPADGPQEGLVIHDKEWIRGWLEWPVLEAAQLPSQASYGMESGIPQSHS